MTGVYRYAWSRTLPGVLTFNGRRVPHIVGVVAGGYAQQLALDLLMHFLRDDIDAERKALALYRPLTVHLRDMDAWVDGWTVTSDELIELVTLILCEQKGRVSGKSDLEYVSGHRRDTVRTQ